MTSFAVQVAESPAELWDRYQRCRIDIAEVGLTLDFSRVGLPRELPADFETTLERAFDAMEALERGAIANDAEERMVGHYWLRWPALAPTAEVAAAITAANDDVTTFAQAVREGRIAGEDGPFEHAIHVGVGGSANGAQLLTRALGGDMGITMHFIDNADPEAIDLVLDTVGDRLGRTLVSVVSKSGWTPTTAHVMQELSGRWAEQGLAFAEHAVATTMPGSQLDEYARSAGWLRRFPVWDWVGGRYSVTSAVGLLPAALQGVDVRALLSGAAAMDARTRKRSPWENPAALLACAWHWLGEGRGQKRMVILPYKERLALFPRFVQQLAMESLGKRFDREGAVVEQGLTVFGHKGSSDGHSYMQQLLEGTRDAFVTFISVCVEREGELQELRPGITLGDYLFGYLEAARNALYSDGRPSITINLARVSPRTLGALVALYERAVGLYAELINVNAYDQPAINKAAAQPLVELQEVATAYLETVATPCTAEEVATAVGRPESAETIFKLLERLAITGRSGITTSGTGFSQHFARPKQFAEASA